MTTAIPIVLYLLMVVVTMAVVRAINRVFLFVGKQWAFESVVITGVLWPGTLIVAVIYGFGWSLYWLAGHIADYLMQPLTVIRKWNDLQGGSL
jgi:hypothetical protein